MNETSQIILSVYAIGFLIALGLMYDVNTDCGKEKSTFKDFCEWVLLSLPSWITFFTIYLYCLYIKIKDYNKD